ncbi:MAG: DNA cytosine methyltransferase [Candidatus Cloacimonetes bacterium]|jgi:DNA (cytosine-5)-methyltransferase 1|nr:DNA cytosine methyltransferase [Candidatus Cloacimonadota bacterium]
MEIYKTIELFAGAGGMAIGFERAGFEPILLVEKDRDACRTLKTNRPQWPIFQGDVTLANYSNLKPDTVTGGFPCQSFSHAGKRLGLEDTRGTLFYEFARCIKETSPKFFLGENVHGLMTHDNGRTFKTVLGVLSDLRYYVEYKLLDSSEFGVPQKRKRLIIVGVNKSLNIGFKWPKKEFPPLTLRDALRGCPSSPCVSYSEKKAKVLELVPPGGDWRDLPDDIAKEYMGKSYYNTDGGRTTYARRISWDKPSPTITCSPAQKQTEICHPDETRPLSVRESARIQTFPDDWIFEGSVSSQYKQIGNAVPVELAYRLANSVRSSLSGDNIENETLFGRV